MLVNSIFAMVLLGISGLLLDSHRRARQRVVATNELDDRTRRFADSQHARRMLASATIGVIGAAIAIRPIIPPQPPIIAIYLLLLVSAVGLIVLLAMIDVLATTVYYRRLRGKQLSAEARLAQELQAMEGDDEPLAPSD